MKQLTRLEKDQNTLRVVLKSEISHLQRLADTDEYDKIIEWSQALIETAYLLEKDKHLIIINKLIDKTE